jgi:hypothetical protein
MAVQPQRLNIMDHRQYSLRKYADFNESISVYKVISKPNDVVKKLLTLTKARVSQDPAPWRSDQGTQVHVFHQVHKDNEYAAVCFFNITPVWPNFVFNTRNADESLAVLLPAFQELCDGGDLEWIGEVQKSNKVELRKLYGLLKQRPASVYIDVTTGLDAGEWRPEAQETNPSMQGTFQSAKSGQMTHGSGQTEGSSTQDSTTVQGEVSMDDLDPEIFRAWMAEMPELNLPEMD